MPVRSWPRSKLAHASRHRGGGRQALRAVLGLPTIYAAAIALIMRALLHIALRDFLLDPTQLKWSISAAVSIAP